MLRREKKETLNLIDTKILGSSILLCMNLSIQFSKRQQQKAGIAEMLHAASIRMEDNECGQLVTNESSCDVFEKALRMTHSREQRESACLEKRL